MDGTLRASRVAWVMVLLMALTLASARANIAVLGVQYKQDALYPEYRCYWHYDCRDDIPGGNAHVFLKNNGAATATISDVTLAGYSLKTVLKRDPAINDANSIHFYWSDPPADILQAGEPVWYKADPPTIPPGGVAQVVVRLRTVPTTPTIRLGVVTSLGTVTTNVPIAANVPILASVGFSEDRTKVYLHWRRSNGTVPTTILLNGTDVTPITTTVGDPGMNFSASVIHLAEPLVYMSYHVFQGVYADGKTATGSLRAWSHPFLHASWSTFPGSEDSIANAQAWIDEATNRGFNAAQNQMIGGSLGAYLNSSAGKAYAESRGGYGVIIWNTSQSNDPLMTFLDDEPDAEESNLENNHCGTGLRLPCGKSPMGILAMREIEKAAQYRALFPRAPTTVNMNGAFRPMNYITWGQVADVLQVDPYYQKRLVDAYWYDASQIPLYRKATYIYAVTKATVTGAEPNPAHPILYSCEWRDTVGGVTKIWPFPTPECKRIEVFYALAAGAKGLSYWWFKPGYPSNGLGDQSKAAARALWKEMGMYGNELKTASHLLVTSHPVDLPLAPSTNVWARALATRANTLILIVVNDNYYNDEAGFHSTDVPNATVTATLPGWMQSPTAFEITTGGIRPVSTQASGNQLQLNLGTLKLTRMIVLTVDPHLLPTLQQRYEQQVRPGLCSFAPEVCTNTTFTIARQPTSQSVPLGGTASFTVTAFGSNLGYQWQRSNTNLADGGRFSGSTTATLTIANCGADDAASYRCIVTSAAGGGNSSNATLTVTTDPPSAPAAQAATSVTSSAFTANWSSATAANGYRLDVSTNSAFSNFVSGYQNLDVGNVLLRRVSGLAASRTYYYRLRAYNGAGTSGDSVTMAATTAAAVPSPPPAPVSAAASGVTTTGFTASWNAASGAAGYRLDVSANSSFGGYLPGYFDLDVGNVLNLGLTGLVSGSNYHYRVRAYNAGGTSGHSATRSVVLPLPVSDSCFGLLNPGFENGFYSAGGGNIGNHWVEWEKNIGVTVGFVESTIVRSGASAQRLRVWGAGGTSGGVYQRVPVMPARANSVTVWIRAGDANSHCSVGIDPTGGTDASSEEIVWSESTTNVAWVQRSVTVTTLADHVTVFYRVTSLDSNARNGYFDDAIPSSTLSGPLQLLAQRTGDSLTLSWPACIVGRLERTENFTTEGGWVTVTNQPTITGGRKTVTLPGPTSASFYRVVLE